MFQLISSNPVYGTSAAGYPYPFRGLVVLKQCGNDTRQCQCAAVKCVAEGGLFCPFLPEAALQPVGLEGFEVRC